MNVSELYGKQTLSGDGKKTGCVIGLGESGGEIRYLVCCDGEEREFRIPAENILSVGDKIIFESGKCPYKQCASIRLGVPAFSDGGKYIGVLSDFILAGFKIKYAVIAGKKYPMQRVEYGDAAIVKKSGAESAAKDMFISAVCESN